MGRNNADFKFAHEQTIDNLNYSPNKFERKLDNALGVSKVNGVKTSVRVGTNWETGGDVLRGTAIKAFDTAEQTAPMPTRKRDVKKAVTKLRKRVAK